MHFVNNVIHEGEFLSDFFASAVGQQHALHEQQPEQQTQQQRQREEMVAGIFENSLEIVEVFIISVYNKTHEAWPK